MQSMTVGRYVLGVPVVDDEPLMRSFLGDALAARARVVEAGDETTTCNIFIEGVHGGRD